MCHHELFSLLPACASQSSEHKGCRCKPLPAWWPVYHAATGAVRGCRCAWYGIACISLHVSISFPVFAACCRVPACRGCPKTLQNIHGVQSQIVNPSHSPRTLRVSSCRAPADSWHERAESLPEGDSRWAKSLPAPGMIHQLPPTRSFHRSLESHSGSVPLMHARPCI